MWEPTVEAVAKVRKGVKIRRWIQQFSENENCDNQAKNAISAVACVSVQLLSVHIVKDELRV